MFMSFVLILSGCIKNQQLNFQDEINLDKVGYENDFSKLNRNIVNRLLNYDECAKKFGATTYWDDPEYHTCSWNNQHFYFSDKWNKNDEKLKYFVQSSKFDSYSFNLNEYINSAIVWVLSYFYMPVDEQNSLIEAFAISQENGKIWKLKFATSDNWKHLESKPNFSVSGGNNLDIQWENNSLKIENNENSVIYTYYFLEWMDDERLNIKWDYEFSKEIEMNDIKRFLKKYIWKEQTFGIVGQNSRWKDESAVLLAEINFEEIKLEHLWYDPNLCLDWICFEKDLPIYEYKNRYIQQMVIENDDDEFSKIVMYNKNLNLIISIQNNFMETETDWSWENGDYTIGQNIFSACLTLNIKQNISGDLDFYVPKNLTIFGEEYQLQDINNKLDLWNNAQNDYGFITSIYNIFGDAQDAEKKITESIKDKNLIYNTYIIRFADNPNLRFTYSNTNWSKNSEAVYFSDEKIPTDDKWNIVDIEWTKKIMCELWHWREFGKEFGENCEEYGKSFWLMVFFDDEKASKINKSQWERVWESYYVLDENVVPIYKIKESNMSNYYFIFPAEWVAFDNGWAWCKPVIYTYDNLKRKNSVKITLPESSKFTKVIPDFSRQTSWDFKTDGESNIFVNGEIYPYLYYSTLWKNYENNRYGWTVAYKDIANFLNVKLDTMNFNQKEKYDFLEYWLPEFVPGYVYSISFKFNEQFEPYAKLDFAHEPEKIFRVFMEAHQLPLATHVSFNPKYPHAWDKIYLQTFDRWSNFNVLEWWGNLVKNNDL